MTDQQIRHLLQRARTIAIVGLSPRPDRPSHRVGIYLMRAGYRVIPVNPGHRQVLGATCYPHLGAIGERVDLVDIFRRADSVGPIVDDAIDAGAGVVWMQQGIVDETAAARARAAGLTVLMDRCIMVEHNRLLH